MLHARHQVPKRSRETDAGIARRQPPLIELSAGTSAGQRLRRRLRLQQPVPSKRRWALWTSRRSKQRKRLAPLLRQRLTQGCA